MQFLGLHQCARRLGRDRGAFESGSSLFSDDGEGRGLGEIKDPGTLEVSIWGLIRKT